LGRNVFCTAFKISKGEGCSVGRYIGLLSLVLY
jgi:hypothetical protein